MLIPHAIYKEYHIFMQLPYCCESTCYLLDFYIDLFLSILVAYMSTSINGGPGCLMLRCPDPSCGAAIGQDMINLLVSEEDKEKYARYLLRSYIEDNRKV